jgi:ArsR family transcriptional regulator
VDESIKLEAGLLHENICQALADPKRIVILYALADHPRNVTEIAEVLEVPQPTASRHLRILRERLLVTTAREGTQVVYSLHDPRIIEALDLMRGMVMSVLRERGRLAETISPTTPAPTPAPDDATKALSTGTGTSSSA